MTRNGARGSLPGRPASGWAKRRRRGNMPQTPLPGFQILSRILDRKLTTVILPDRTFSSPVGNLTSYLNLKLERRTKMAQPQAPSDIPITIGHKPTVSTERKTIPITKRTGPVDELDGGVDPLFVTV